MKIAFFMDFQVPINRREGITAYVGYLLNALLESIEDIEIEIWLFSHNEENFRREFRDILSQHGTRIHIFTECSFPNRRGIEINHYLKYQIFKCAHHLAKIAKLKRLENGFGYRASSHYGIHKTKIYDMARSFNHNSSAKLAFVPFPGLTTAINVDVPCVVQIHDLFTFPLCELFDRESYPRANFKKGNKITQNIVEAYAKKNSIFVSSAEYIRDTQILKYIKKATINNCRCVPFPPMYTKFNENDVLKEHDFRQKHCIEAKYVAFPSQNRPNKNLIVLLKALKRVNEKGTRLVLATTGRMSNCNSTNAFVKDNKDLVIELNGLNLQDLFCLYKYSEMVVCPNIIEGMGISGQCLEALSVGKPVVHAKSMGISESLSRVGLDMQNADLLWFDLNDDEQLAKNILYVLDNKETVIKRQRHVLDAYNQISWNDVANKYEEIFESLL